MSNQFPGKVNAAGWGPHFENHQSKSIVYKIAQEPQSNATQSLRPSLPTAPSNCVCARVGFYFFSSSNLRRIPLCPVLPIHNLPHCPPSSSRPAPPEQSARASSGLLIFSCTAAKAQQLSGEGRGR